MLSMAASVVAGERMVWKQDLNPNDLKKIDMENLDNPWNDQFKAPQSTYKAKPMRKRLRQADEDAAQAEAAQNASDEPESINVCDLSLARDTRTNLYMLIYGYVQGLYPSENYPDTGCSRCSRTALPFSQLVYATSNVLSLFEELLNDDLASQAGTDQLNFLYESYLVFWEFGINFDILLNDDSSKIQYKQFLNVTDDSYTDAIRQNVQEHLFPMMALYSHLDFKNGECKQIGVVTGALMRKAFSFMFTL